MAAFASPKFLTLALSLCCSTLLFADGPYIPGNDFAEFHQDERVSIPLFEAKDVAPPTPVAEKATPKKADKALREAPFSPFTGKVKSKKLRIRLEADLDSRIIKELKKDEYVAIIGEKGDFFAVEPPSETKAYIFRSFVLDNVVEGNRVNVRLEPNLEAPIIAHLSSGDRLDSPTISSLNNKWFEIAPPESAKFYVAKEYIDYAGGPELKAQIDRRLATCKQLLEATAILSQAELKKAFQEIDFDRVAQVYSTVLKEYAEFPDVAEHAKEALAAFQEGYLEKRIAYLETRPALPSQEEREAKQALLGEIGEALFVVTERMKSWEPIEDALYASWANISNSPSFREFYEDQKLTAVTLSGWVEAYNSPTKNKPGDFIIRDKEIPIGYVYSTQVNLQALVGKHVTLIASPRSNNNFAFPAYYALGVE